MLRHRTKLIMLLVLALLALSAPGIAQSQDAKKPETEKKTTTANKSTLGPSVDADIKYLASDELEGRGPAPKGSKKLRC